MDDKSWPANTKFLVEVLSPWARRGTFRLALISVI